MQVIKHILTGSKTLIKGVRHCVLYVFVKALVCVFMGTVILFYTLKRFLPIHSSIYYKACLTTSISALQWFNKSHFTALSSLPLLQSLA